jgi:predicted MFS family arabinose efflux permease
VTTETRTPALWRNVPYAWLWAGQTVSRLGTAITAVAFPLLVLELAPSAQVTGTASALITLGNVLLTPVGGILSDRGDPRRLMMAVDLARFVFIGSLPLAFALGAVSLLHLYVVAFLVGSGRAVFDIAHSALLPRLVARKQLAEANSGLWTSFSVAQMLGPSFGGFLVAALGAAYAMGLDAASFLVSAASLLGVRPVQHQERSVGGAAARGRHPGPLSPGAGGQGGAVGYNVPAGLSLRARQGHAHLGRGPLAVRQC